MDKISYFPNPMQADYLDNVDEGAKVGEGDGGDAGGDGADETPKTGKISNESIIFCIGVRYELNLSAGAP